ncbi:MAG TPA: response regulator, partial [Anaerolineae bacterium]|nr:response regulator [Anaerolineae bacterium]
SVLVVDDEPMARNLLRLMLIREGFGVLEAVDGNDALLVLDQHRPDLIVLDVMMPELDGMTLCESLRSRVDLADLPIIMLSARTDAKSVEQGLASGASRYLSKPISADILTSHVRDLLTMVVAPS